MNRMIGLALLGAVMIAAGGYVAWNHLMGGATGLASGDAVPGGAPPVVRAFQAQLAAQGMATRVNAVKPRTGNATGQYLFRMSGNGALHFYLLLGRSAEAAAREREDYVRLGTAEHTERRGSLLLLTSQDHPPEAYAQVRQAFRAMPWVDTAP